MSIKKNITYDFMEKYILYPTAATRPKVAHLDKNGYQVNIFLSTKTYLWVHQVRCF